MPQQRRGRAQPLGKPRAPARPPMKSSSSSARARITSGRSSRSPRTSSPPICPAALLVGASAAPGAAGQIAQARPAGQTPITRQELAERSSPTRCRCASRCSCTKSSGRRSSEAFEPRMNTQANPRPAARIRIAQRHVHRTGRLMADRLGAGAEAFTSGTRKAKSIST